ncbi:tetratricopeptide repeat protein [Sporosarcina sp. GW1-11]|uniref:tetratricopeptide repeat protein n=1 Tax=Sporosarcina sp. GW1-11 TaxID=2899126 RepID=UPI00294C9F93|nr:tetratricopeptide repeat protein [Sporosarcina sp. GW1-11]MDV6378554.1 tetratricopeptide repeat protein [Sporosarcina sp. GW1-11]
MSIHKDAISEMQQGNYEKAIELFMKAVEENPDDATGFINIGNIFASLGDAEQAEPFFQKALTLDKNAGTAFYGLANLYYNQERFEEAAKLYEKAMQTGLESADVYFMLGKSIEQAGNDRLALPYLQRAVELSENDHEIALSYGILLAKMELFEQAQPVFEAILQAQPEHADAHYNLGVLFAVSTEDQVRALSHLKQAYTIEPEHTQARYLYDMITIGTEQGE